MCYLQYEDSVTEVLAKCLLSFTWVTWWNPHNKSRYSSSVRLTSEEAEAQKAHPLPKQTLLC